MLNALVVIPFVLIVAIDTLFLVRWAHLVSLTAIGAQWLFNLTDLKQSLHRIAGVDICADTLL